MSAINDAMKGIKHLLTLQHQVGALEEAGRIQREDMKALARDLVGIDKRLTRIEAMVEMVAGRGQPRLER